MKMLRAYLTIFILGASTVLAVRSSRIHFNNHEQQLNRDRRLLPNGETLYWPKAIVPYVIADAEIPYKPMDLKIMAAYEANTCVRFIPWNETVGQLYALGHNGNLKFIKDNGCYSFVSFQNKKDQIISCCTNIACVHEIGHALGFTHETESPLRAGWIRMDTNSIWPRNQDEYRVGTSKAYTGRVMYPYDIASAMHGESHFHLLFPELNLVDELYYQFKELSLTYNCLQYSPCNGKQLGCVNDGYTSIYYGKCQCVCPEGLDPVTLCAKPVNKVSMPWPKGQYSLPMPKSGCPSNEFKKGNIKLYGIVMSKGNTDVQQEFCTRTIQDDTFNSVDEEKWNWPLGNYCIYKGGNKCPLGFNEGSINFGSAWVSRATGKLPAGEFNTSLSIEFCCQYRGIGWFNSNLPSDKPFSVIKLEEANICQAITGARSQEEVISYYGSGFKTTGTLPFVTGNKNRVSMTFCHYTPVDMNCGDVIVLGNSIKETRIEFNGTGRTDLECTWVIKGDVEQGSLVLDFEEMNVKMNGDVCVDKVHVKHALIGQLGEDYCGQSIGHSIKSMTNKMMIRFFTFGQSESSFKAKVKWIPNEVMCYDVDDRGVSYDLKVNYTRMFEPCLPWAQVSQCYHNPFRKADIMDNLEGNYCRNPDNSFGPWCYTDINGCLRNYCDVCGVEKPYDKIQDCARLKKGGFCERDRGMALKHCAETCKKYLLSSNQKYTDVKCESPQPPNDGKVIGHAKSIYNLGEVVQFQCKNGLSIVPSTCMTSGQWSPVHYACLECPFGSSSYNGTCLLLYKKNGGYTREEAVDVCAKDGGVLFAPRNQLQNDLTQSAINGKEAWIAINDTKKEGSWVYDEDNQQLEWTYWLQNQPNNYGGQDCGLMDPNGRWEDYSCTKYKAHAVCQITKPKINHCFDFFGDRCSSLLEDNPSMCLEFQGHVRIYCRKTCGLCSGSKLTCSTGISSENVNRLSSETSISVGQSVSYSCAKYSYKIGGDEVRACSSVGMLTGHPLQCGECPLGFVSSKYACHGTLMGKFTFTQAREECGKIGGYIAMPRSPGENDIVSSVALEEDAWIGAGYYKGGYEWGDQSSVSWNNWADGEPKITKGHCAIISKNTEWISVNCNGNQYVTVCTIPKTDNYACFDISDKGILYDGNVNKTIYNTPCTQWTDMTDCNNHPWKSGKEFYNLEHNYCRNSDESLRPWCYTSIGCGWDYCDVCLGNKPKSDTANDCGEQRDNGVCTNDVTKAAQECAKTCSDLLPNMRRTHYRNVKCQKPNVPTGVVISGTIKSEYSLGDVATLKCKTSGFVVNTTCMTSGSWSQAGQVCSQCPLSFSLVNNICYGWQRKQLTYSQAEKACASIGGSLPIPKSIEENNDLKLSIKSNYVWLGAKRTSYSTPQVFVQQNGAAVEWTNWNSGFPNQKYRCAIIKRNGKWENTDCELTSWDIGLVCVVPKQTTITCADYFDKQCKAMLINRPTMCADEEDFVQKYCQKTCGLCQ